jgi:hypothetical protein
MLKVAVVVAGPVVRVTGIANVTALAAVVEAIAGTGTENDFTEVAVVVVVPIVEYKVYEPATSPVIKPKLSVRFAAYALAVVAPGFPPIETVVAVLSLTVRAYEADAASAARPVPATPVKFCHVKAASGNTVGT